MSNWKRLDEGTVVRPMTYPEYLEMVAEAQHTLRCTPSEAAAVALKWKEQTLWCVATGTEVSKWEIHLDVNGNEKQEEVAPDASGEAAKEVEDEDSKV